jgi:hypothetical protein
MSLAYPLSSILAELVVGMPNLEVFVWDLPWAMDEGLWEALMPGMLVHNMSSRIDVGIGRYLPPPPDSGCLLQSRSRTTAPCMHPPAAVCGGV